jgi:predicted transcriptional regulator
MYMADWDGFCQTLFELSNESRLSIVMRLMDGSSTVTELANQFSISTQEASRHLTRLTSSGLVIRDSDGAYNISEYGRLTFSTLSSHQFITKNKEYFLLHEASHIPREYQARLGELYESTSLDDIPAVFQKIQDVIENAEEYICRLTDRRFNLVYPSLQSAADRGVEFRLIETLEYQSTTNLDQFKRVHPSETRGLESIPIFLAMSEKEVASIAFPSGDRFDYRGFTSSSPDAIKWCRDLFQYYWEHAQIKV